MSNVRAFFGIERELERYYLRLKRKHQGKIDLRQCNPLEALENTQDDFTIRQAKTASPKFQLEDVDPYHSIFGHDDRRGSHASRDRLCSASSTLDESGYMFYSHFGNAEHENKEPE